MPRVLGDGNEQPSVLHSNTSVYRALLRSAGVHRETGMILPDAYIPRENGKDDDGLSVTVVTSNTEWGVKEGAHALACRFDKVYGIVILVVGKVREIDCRLDVVRDPKDDQPNHALITGVPRIDQNRDLAERLAGQLARSSQKVR